MINPGWYAYAVCKNNTRQLVFEYSSPVHRAESERYMHALARVCDIEIEELIRVEDKNLDHRFDREDRVLLAAWEINQCCLPVTVTKYSYSILNVVGLEFWVVKNHGAINEANIPSIEAPLLKKEVICNEEQTV